MSRYEDYESTADNYDTTRVPVGLEQILTQLEEQRAHFSELLLLDCGCGTGNYLRALGPHIDRGIGVDGSASMLTQARAKLTQLSNIELRQGSLTALPAEGESVNVVLCTQVLHHLDPPNAPNDFPTVRAVLGEFHRVLQPGGLLLINSSSHQQSIDGYWWADLIPAAVQRCIHRLPDIQDLHSYLDALGFNIVHTTPVLDEVLQGQAYFDPTGPLQPQWRNGDSTWALATEDELKEAKERVQSLQKEGKLQAYFDHRELLRAKIGQHTQTVARKRN